MAEENYSEQSKAIIERLKAEGLLTRNTGANSIKAVIDRLKLEGDLLRNSGTNSIKSVKIEMERFRGVFQSISENAQQQAEMLSSSLRIAQEQREDQRRAEDLSEVEQLSDEARTLKDEYNLLKIKNDLADEKEREKNRKTGILDVLKGFGSTIKKFLIGAIIGVVGLTFLRGFIDALSGGAITRFEQWGKEQLPRVLDAFDRLVEIVSDPNFLKTLGYIAAIATPLSVLASVLPTILQALQTAAIFKLLRQRQQNPTGVPPVVVPTDGRGAPPTTQRPTGSRQDRRRQWRDSWATGTYMGGGQQPNIPPQTTVPSEVPEVTREQAATRRQRIGSLLKSANLGRNLLIGALGTSILAVSETASQMINDETKNISPEDIENMPITQYSQSVSGGISTIVGAATLGSMFGIKGAIAGAIIGGVYVLGKAAYEKVNDYFNDTDLISNEVQASLQKAQTDARLGLDSTQAYRDYAKATERSITEASTEITEKERQLANLRKGLQEYENMSPAEKARYNMLDPNFAESTRKSMERLLNEIDEKKARIAAETDLLRQLPESVKLDLATRQNQFDQIAGGALGSPILVVNNSTMAPNVINNVSGGPSIMNNNVASFGGGSPWSLPGNFGLPSAVQ